MNDVSIVAGSADLNAGENAIFRITEGFSPSNSYRFSIITTKGTRVEYVSRAPSGTPTTPTYAVDFVLDTGGLSLSPGDGDYSGDIAISATANTNYVFNQWQSTGSITFDDAGSASTTATINGAGTITATFTYIPVISQVTFVSAGVSNGRSSSDPTPSYPSSLEANDLILLQVTVRGNSIPTITPPVGFTLLQGPHATEGSSSRVTQWIYYKFSIGSETGTATVGVTGTYFDRAARMYAFRNVALSSFTEDPDSRIGDDDVILAEEVTTAGDKRLVDHIPN